MIANRSKSAVRERAVETVAEEPDEVCADVGEEEPSILPLPHLSNTAAARLPDHRGASEAGSSREAAGAPSPPVKREGEGEGEWEEGDEWLADVGEEETPISHPLCSSSTFSIATRDGAGSTANKSKSQQGLSVAEPCDEGPPPAPILAPAPPAILRLKSGAEVELRVKLGEGTRGKVMAGVVNE
ncbi:unnamed protein product [Vitrella brassicaformis CCMP3155]|uniref:Uncharacterized protein n=1 Tax=Vitrella brassicaformis (strain CCMP3155) TaxID=1169540 RepID=A0A0G4EUS7_VITBC|nr:unnamed protein product [Vitrella brassicaformis CCMP3155]|eukprot:CEM02209.1 unnamed protein product [Vitrella brassicaformis CCMP3155]